MKDTTLHKYTGLLSCSGKTSGPARTFGRLFAVAVALFASVHIASATSTEVDVELTGMVDPVSGWNVFEYTSNSDGSSPSATPALDNSGNPTEIYVFTDGYYMAYNNYCADTAGGDLTFEIDLPIGTFEIDPGFGIGSSTATLSSANFSTITSGDNFTGIQGPATVFLTFLNNGYAITSAESIGITQFECSSSPQQEFLTTGSMNAARIDHTLTLLPSRLVLAAGGEYGSCGCSLASAELYDPATGTWTATGSMNAARESFTATLLPNGLMLVAGGEQWTSATTTAILAGAELYDPTTGTWRTTGSMHAGRSGHTATLLPNGLVLVAGGWGGSSILAGAELYDPATETWTTTGSLTDAREIHSAVLLPNGQVLVAGGEGVTVTTLASAELYDPTAGTWTTTGSLSTGRFFHAATLLPSGSVLVSGGAGLTGVATAELYNPSTGTWAATGTLNQARDSHTATLLSNGKVLVAGGEDAYMLGIASAELYDPSTGVWTQTASLNQARAFAQAVLLSNGSVLTAGGYDLAYDSVGDYYYASFLSSAELYYY